MEKTVNGDAIADVIAAARDWLSPTAVEQLKSLGVPLEGEPAENYPADVWRQCVQLIAADVFRGVDTYEAQRRLAHLRIDQVKMRPQGLLFSLSGIAGKERAMGQYVARLAAGASYFQARFTVTAKGRYEIHVSDVTQVPGFFAGMLERGFFHLTGTRVPLKVEKLEGEACTWVNV